MFIFYITSRFKTFNKSKHNFTKNKFQKTTTKLYIQETCEQWLTSDTTAFNHDNNKKKVLRKQEVNSKDKKIHHMVHMYYR